MNLYSIADHRGNYHSYTARDFRNIVISDAKYDYYDWHATVEEIARVVKVFPKGYRDDICREVLRCFARFQVRHRIYSSEQEAIWECFMMLESDGNKNDSAKSHYMSCIIEKVIRCESIFKIHMGTAWWNFCREYHSKKDSEWPKLKTKRKLVKWAEGLPEDFARKLKKAEEAGVFDEDDEKGMKMLMKLTSRIDCGRWHDSV